MLSQQEHTETETAVLGSTDGPSIQELEAKLSSLDTATNQVKEELISLQNETQATLNEVKSQLIKPSETPPPLKEAPIAAEAPTVNVEQVT